MPLAFTQEDFLVYFYFYLVNLLFNGDKFRFNYVENLASIPYLHNGIAIVLIHDRLATQVFTTH